LSSNFESSKTLAAIGAILMFLGFIPVVGIVGIILVLIGMKGLAEHYSDESIYRNTLTGVIFGIVALIALSVGVFSIGAIFSLGVAGIIGGILGLLLLLAIVFIFILLMAINFRKAFYALADRSGEQLFHTAGTLLFIGAALTIVFFIGLILVFIAWIIATIGFFSLRETQQPNTSSPPPQPAPSSTQAARFCPYCGAPIDQNATFCSHCGKQLT
jgi:uncharacterized membrane protein